MNENVGVYLSIKFKIIPFCAIKFPIRDITQYSGEMQAEFFIQIMTWLTEFPFSPKTRKIIISV